MHAVEQEAVPRDLRIEPARVLAQRCEALVAGCEADARADRSDVVEVAPEPFELEQERAGACDLIRRPQAEDLLGSVRVGHAIGDRAGAACPRGVVDAVVKRLPGRGSLEAAVLVEEPDVQVQDAIADDMQPEVARFDHAGMDRADRDLVGVGAVQWHGPGGELARVVDQRAHRLVPVELHAVEIVRLALRPLRSGCKIDEARGAPVADGNADQIEGAVGLHQHRTHDLVTALADGVQAGQPAATRERVGHDVAIVDIGAGAHSSPRVSARAMSEPGRASAPAVSASRSTRPAAASATTSVRPGGMPGRMPRLRPATASMSA